MAETHNARRRRFLVATTTVVGAGGLVMAAVPFVVSMTPSDRARLAGAPVQIDFSKLEPAQQITVKWRGKPIWILHRTKPMLDRLKEPALKQRLRDPDSKESSQQPPYAQNDFRSIKPEFLVVVALCTHLGCVPTYRPDVGAADLGSDWPGGYFCPCHGSRYDLSGRVFQGVPAPLNLLVPSYHYIADRVIEIGVDPKKSA